MYTKVGYSMLEIIKSMGYKPYDIKTDFLWDATKDASFTFKIKGLCGWKFGMWINSSQDKDEYIQIFAQHKDNIDKFKPSRSSLLIEYSLDDYERMIEKKDYYGCDLKTMLGFIKRHPFIAYWSDGCYSDYFDRSYISSYLRSKIRIYSSKAKSNIMDFGISKYTRFKIMLCKNNSIIKSVKFIDRNSDECVCYPRYSIDIIFHESSTPKEEVKFLDKWFKEDNYYNTHLHYGKKSKGYYYYPKG